MVVLKETEKVLQTAVLSEEEDEDHFVLFF